MLSILGSLISPITGVVEQWQKRKTARVEQQMAIEKAETDAKIRYLETAQEAEIKWEETALKTAGWKDEYLLVVFSIPLIMCFVPGLVEYVERGFEALQQTPDWYQWAIGVMVAASFGYRKIADFMGRKK